MIIKITHIVGVFFTIIAGILLHFTYQWSGENVIVGAFSAVNESTWEHLKLLFFPILAFMIAEYFIYADSVSGFFTAKLLAVLGGMTTIVVLFYTYMGVIGQSPSAVNIAIFIIGVIVNYLLSYKWLTEDRFKSGIINAISFAIIILIAILFVFYTYYRPKLNIFVPPVM